MTNLIRILHGAEDNEMYSAQTELPLAFRIHENGSQNTRTIKSEFILRTGSHHGYPFNALFAHRLYQELSGPGSTTERISELLASNLAVLAENPGNIVAITSCMPTHSDAVRIIRHAFPDFDQQGVGFEESDFAYFVKGESKLPKKLTASTLLIAEIYVLFQHCNRIEPTDKFKARLDAILNSSLK